MKKVILLLLTVHLCGLQFAQYNPIDSLTRKLHVTVQPSEKIELLLVLSQRLENANQEQARRYAEQALFLAESIENIPQKARAQFQIALIEDSKGNSTIAYDYFSIARDNFRAVKDDLQYAKVCLKLGELLKRRYEFDKSLSLFFVARDIFESENHKSELANCINQIGGNYYEQGNYIQAAYYFNESLKLYQSLNDSTGIAGLLNNIGETYRLTQQPTRALKYYRNSLAIELKNDNEYRLSTIYSNIGNIHLTLENFDTSAFYLNKSLSISKKVQSDDLFSTASINLGQLYLEVNQPDSAKHYLLLGHEKAKKQNKLTNIQLASKYLHQLYAKAKNYPLALKHHKEFKLISDSLQSINTKESITRLEMNHIHNNEQRIREIIQQQKVVKYTLMFAVLLLVLILLIVLYGRQRIINKHNQIYFENLKLEQHKLKEDNEHKNRELATHVMYMVKKNELINYINSKLLKIENNFKSSNKKQIHQIIKSLQQNVDENIWNKFIERFNEVHNNFYSTLFEKYPSLTENEKKLCAFLRLNMTTKEIAAITHQSINSIEVARTRLRKKLAITNTETSISQFLGEL